MATQADDRDFPLSAAFRDCAITLGAALDGLDYPNANRRNSAFTENNLILHLGAAIRQQDPRALMYAELALPQGQRLDLLVHSEDANYLIEAKVLGPFIDGCASLARQFDRMIAAIRPACYPRADESRTGQWWDASKATWGVLLLGSHAEITPAWRMPPRDDALTHIWPEPRSVRQHGESTALSVLLARLDAVGAFYYHQPVLGTVFKDSSPLDLLWAAFPIERQGAG